MVNIGSISVTWFLVGVPAFIPLALLGHSYNTAAIYMLKGSPNLRFCFLSTTFAFGQFVCRGAAGSVIIHSQANTTPTRKMVILLTGSVFATAKDLLILPGQRMLGVARGTGNLRQAKGNPFLLCFLVHVTRISPCRSTLIFFYPYLKCFALVCLCLYPCSITSGVLYLSLGQ